MNGYTLLRDWYNYKFLYPSKVKATHSDLYCYLIDLWNRLGQKDEFGLPTNVTMEALGIGSYNTYKKILNDLIDFGFVKLVSESKNQHQSKVIALSKIDKALDKALDKATAIAPDKAPDTIIKQINKETNNTKAYASEVLPENEKPLILPEHFDKMLAYFNKTFNKDIKQITRYQRENFYNLIRKGYTQFTIKDVIDNLKNDEFCKSRNYIHVTIDYISQIETVEKYAFVHLANKQESKPTKGYGVSWL